MTPVHALISMLATAEGEAWGTKTMTKYPTNVVAEYVEGDVRTQFTTASVHYDSFGRIVIDLGEPVQIKAIHLQRRMSDEELVAAALTMVPKDGG